MEAMRVLPFPANASGIAEIRQVPAVLL